MKDIFKRIEEKTKHIWQGLKPRERFLVASTLSLFFAFVIIQWGILAPLKTMQQADKRNQQLRQDFVTLNELYPKFKQRQKRKPEATSSQASNKESLLALIEQKSLNINLKDRVRYMRPSSTPIEGKYEKKSVELKIEQILIRQIIQFIYTLEREQGIFVESFLLRDAYNKPGYYDLTIRISRLEKA